MPQSTLHQLGILTVPSFLTDDECREWRSIAKISDSRPACIYKDYSTKVEKNFRNTLQIDAQPSHCNQVVARIKELQPRLETYFNTSLHGTSSISCLRYRTGDFFKLHSDVAPKEFSNGKDQTNNLFNRTITIVVFLNQEDDRDDPYEGGTLSLFGLLHGSIASAYGIPIKAETGLLIAFRADLLHEVSEVTAGDRYTLLTWFHHHDSSFKA